jgi:hypothetical protein
MFPESFNNKIYRKLHDDLQNIKDDDLIDHYNNIGKNEGRVCCEISSKNALLSYINTENALLSYINTEVLDCLEIGPSDNPVLTC